ncbi:hypothetical protein [Methylobacterium nonmethylotrophicum]|uniref:Uncharacterized protein n=1 Tax=Methylobacterium nonmethylotrophicum TaxID=1141884 RepID=A0A4Z0NVS8_9HYPH|nr:hypothetical protein [Methylobacterium nonmethylotrophicum]TGE01792.1 hypothetical protein EU555_03730 [Methylobacterium nonmethylotrophicum]
MVIIKFLSDIEIKKLVELAKSDNIFWTNFKDEERRCMYVYDLNDENAVRILDPLLMAREFIAERKIDDSSWPLGQLIMALRGVARQEIEEENSND